MQSAKNKKDYLVVADPDPTVKIKKVKKEDFAKEWSGVVLFIAPAPNFRPKDEKSTGLLSFVPLLLRQRKLITNIVIAALLVTIINILGSYLKVES
ncbi:peptide ABC transporter ATP-binding protein [Secundilactobacillus oryzae JCM 18671]|uniref:Peptide ABC transporter ATP-binding protein, partial n=1 Tax=Secundilactobacillus oryzae JCM 18671 TaxID=1291743 RepID=A0A081BKF9_9LACO|nr:cysteine peptidase family C39 domain-containing protein [Secundilactobacillus oryzae]GAK48527.1 peptide ABC transporter ATP-binding protein [Secundilactobacillus oryzae JCM 18671]